MDDRHCLSYIEETPSSIRDGCARFVMNVRTWIFFHPAGTCNSDQNANVWNVKEFTPGEKKEFKRQFELVISKGLGDGAMWIAHTQKGTKDLWVDITISWAPRETADLCVLAIKDPTIKTGSATEFRANCLIGGAEEEDIEGGSSAPEMNVKTNPIDMRITLDQVIHGPHGAFKQYIPMHEFGHYLGMDHFCAAAGAPNSAAQYCSMGTTWQKDDLMAMGSQVRDHHVDKVKDRFLRHSYLSPWRKVRPVWGVVAKGGVTGPGTGDRQNRPWKGTPLGDEINRLTG